MPAEWYAPKLLPEVNYKGNVLIFPRHIHMSAAWGKNRTWQLLTAGVYPTLHFILTFQGGMIIIHYSVSLELQTVLTFIQSKTKNSATKKTQSILLHDNKPKSLNLIFNFLLDNPFVFQNLCHLWITWERNTAWIISLPFLMTTF